MMAEMFEVREDQDTSIRANRYTDGTSVIRVRDECSGWAYIRLTKDQTESLARFLVGE